MKEILDILDAAPVDMGGFPVKQPLPHRRLEHLDPFLLLHHAGPITYEGGERAQALGVGPHPHRGFEPVTFIYRGGVHHRDSRGNDSIVHAGGVQWMTAGMGIVHSERPPADIARNGGEQEIIQLWVNLPAMQKMVQPRYQSAERAQMPLAPSADERVNVAVVAGEFENVKGPMKTVTPIVALNVVMARGTRRSFGLPEGHNAFAYFLDGACTVNEKSRVQGENLVAFESTSPGDVRIEAHEDARILLMAGEPINEDVVSSGPFVMNTHTQILEAMRDYKMGKMGLLVEEFS